MALVCVTGGSGFVGSQVASDLLDAGHQVRATTRDLASAKVQLGSLKIEWATADLNAPDSFVSALKDCDYVIHTASPFVLTVEDPQRDLVDPAVNGTLAVLEAALANSVQRVVLTSSFAAVSDEPDGVFTETEWNTKSSLTRNPYYYAKAAAEKAAWDFAAAHQGFELVVINPTYVLGPSLVPSLNETSRTLVGLVSGMFPGVLNIDYPFVDVRDVARAHRLAMETPEAHGRYLCGAETWSQRRVVDWIKGANLGFGKPPRLHMDNPVGTALAKVAARFQASGDRDYIHTHIGRHPRIDTTKIRTELGMSFRPLGETLIDSYRDLEKWGHLSKKVGT
ncbi:MAG: NAD-dependent epimerase/dehydratase family protein [Acidimicrobiia bacterium]